MSPKHEIRRTKLWLSAAVIFALSVFALPDSLAASARRVCIAGCRSLKKDCIGKFKLQFTTAKAVCKEMSEKADRKQCKRDLRPKRAAFKAGKQECIGQFRKNCKQCCKRDPMEECRNTSFIVCGDGNTTGAEECDDSNTDDGDGCSHACRVEARCGDGTVDADEECEADSECLAHETCVACSCRPRCENDFDCGDDEDCVSGGCVQRLGTRTFSLGTDSAIMSSFLSSVLPGFLLGTPTGTIELEAGAPDKNGVATVSTPADGGPYFITVDVDLEDFHQQFTICSKVASCEGTLHCRGGANVDVEVELDSLAGNLTCEQVAQCHPDEPCCDNACEGAKTEPPYTPQNPWTPVTSSNVPVNLIGVKPGDSGPGAMVLTCQVAALDVPLGTNCTAAAYEESQATVLTTGENTARVVHHCPGGGASPGTVPEFSKKGENFTCSEWAREDSAGALAFSIPTEEPTNVLFTGDGAQAGVYDD